MSLISIEKNKKTTRERERVHDDTTVRTGLTHTVRRVENNIKHAYFARELYARHDGHRTRRYHHRQRRGNTAAFARCQRTRERRPRVVLRSCARACYIQRRALLQPPPTSGRERKDTAAPTLVIVIKTFGNRVGFFFFSGRSFILSTHPPRRSVNFLRRRCRRRALRFRFGGARGGFRRSRSAARAFARTRRVRPHAADSPTTAFNVSVKTVVRVPRFLFFFFSPHPLLVFPRFFPPYRRARRERRSLSKVRSARVHPRAHGRNSFRIFFFFLENKEISKNRV